MRSRVTERPSFRLELDDGTQTEIRWLMEQGHFPSEQAVVEAGVRQLSKVYRQQEAERRQREELARLTRYKPYDLG